MKPLATLGKLTCIGLLALSAGVVQAYDETSKENIDIKELREMALGIFETLPTVQANLDAVKANKEMISLGQTLFFDPRLSKGGTVSCNSCHSLASYGVDNLPTSQGWKANFGGRNAPTVLNSSLFTSQFWDGRAKDVEEQAGGPILNPVEMALPDEQTAENIIKSIPDYQPLFDQAYGAAKKPGANITYKNITNAIGAFERTLLTPTRFDKFLAGDDSALTAQEMTGLQKFADIGCTSCHHGPGLGGDQFQKFGLVQGPYWQFTGSKKPDDGRFEVTQSEDDRYLFRVPGLRNIAKTYPYFHDGSVWSLERAVDIMAQAQLGSKLPQQDLDDIVAFLKSLTGEIPMAARTLPILPENGPKTPRPDNN